MVTLEERDPNSIAERHCTNAQQHIIVKPKFMMQ